jgi:hypothetical protein
MLLITGLILLGPGIGVWLYGDRMWLLGAGAGALLGMALLNPVPALATGGLNLLIVGGLAVLFGVLGFIGKAFAKIIAMIIGFIAGGATMLGFLDILGLTSVGFWAWILAVIGSLIGAGWFARFLDWALIIFASLLGPARTHRRPRAQRNRSHLEARQAPCAWSLTRSAFAVDGCAYHALDGYTRAGLSTPRLQSPRP